MPLTPAEVEHIAELARLELTPREKTRYLKQLSSILDYIQKLQELDTKNIPATSSVLPSRSMLRADDPTPGLTREETLQNAARVEKGQIRVPPIFGDRND
jgi:aspartyl-tRNA(Asn)/glutamyl-tRNA(Gln) amidotransferase subunit C